MPNKPKGLRKTGGRKKGVSNKATREIKDIAQDYGPAAIAELARIMKEGESEASRVSAIKELLDRAYGRAPQAVTVAGDPENPIKHEHKFAWMTKEEALARGWSQG